MLAIDFNIGFFIEFSAESITISLTLVASFTFFIALAAFRKEIKSSAFVIPISLRILYSFNLGSIIQDVTPMSLAAYSK